MSNLTWVPFKALFYREIHRFYKVVVQTIVAPIVNSFLYLLIFGVSLGQSIQLADGVSYLAFIIPGLVMMGSLNNAFANCSSSVVGSKFSGELEDYKASPLSYQQIIWALSFGGLARGFLVGAVTLIVGEVFYYFQMGELIPVQHPLYLLFFIVIGGLSFAKLGLTVAFWAKSFDHLSAIGSFVILPLIYLGGVFYSIDKLPSFWQSISKFNPLLYMINGVRYSILGVSDVNIGAAMLITLLMLVGFHIIALKSLMGGNFKRW